MPATPTTTLRLDPELRALLDALGKALAREGERPVNRTQVIREAVHRLARALKVK